MTQRGAASIVGLAGGLALCLFAFTAADLGAMLHARARAQAAADAAALAAVTQQAPVLGQGDDPEAAASAVADANGARLLRCSCRVGDVAATVEVDVPARLAVMRPWFGRRPRATATAVLDPDVFSYRDGGG